MENAIEWLTGQKTCTISTTDRKWINRLKKAYSESHDQFIRYIENEDGSVYATIPSSWVKFNNHKRMMSEEQRQAAAERLKAVRRNV